MDKTLAKQKDEILFVRIDNDGYNLGAQRREIKGSDIPEVIKIIKDYQNGLDIPDNPLVTKQAKGYCTKIIYWLEIDIRKRL